MASSAWEKASKRTMARVGMSISPGIRAAGYGERGDGEARAHNCRHHSMNPLPHPLHGAQHDTEALHLDTLLPSKQLKHLFNSVWVEVHRMDFSDARSIVHATMQRAAGRGVTPCVTVVDGCESDRDYGFYSKSILVCSRVDTITALKTYYVMVADEHLAAASRHTLIEHVLSVVPDDQCEPVPFAQLVELRRLREITRGRLAGEEGVLASIRKTVAAERAKSGASVVRAP